MVKRDWKLLNKPDRKEIQKLVNRLDISKPLAYFLLQKNMSEDEIIDFLTTNPNQLLDPFTMLNMNTIVDRIFLAVDSGQKILVYGDYDVDGITSTAIISETLEALGADYEYYIPNRFKDGYGPNVDRYQEFIDQGVDLIITVDNGVSGHEAIELAKDKGVDVIITDHHKLPEILPNAFAILHPSLNDNPYEFKKLSGAGVAFKLAQALLTVDESDIEVPVEFLDLVALGTVADVVSLTGENRTLVKLGLNELNKHTRLGINILCNELNISDTEMITSETISFKLSPVLNSAGRISSATKSLELLLSQNTDEAQRLVTEILKDNEVRKNEVDRIIAETKTDVLSRYKANNFVVLIGENWPEGILGIVAARYANTLKKPCLVATKVDGIYKGSGRTFGNVNLFDILNAHHDKFKAFGGHADAVGFSFEETNLNHILNLSNVVEVDDKDLVDTKYISITLPLSKINKEFYNDISLLEPFGQDNPKPLILLKDIENNNTVSSLSNGKHLKIKLGNFDALAFNNNEFVKKAYKAKKFDILGTLSLNYFKNQVSVQLMIDDMHFVSEQNSFDDINKHFYELYMFLLKYPNVDYANHLDDLAGYLKVDKKFLLFMFNVLIELNIIKISNKKMSITSSKKINLNDSTTYKMYVQQLIR